MIRGCTICLVPTINVPSTGKLGKLILFLKILFLLCCAQMVVKDTLIDV